MILSILTTLLVTYTTKITKTHEESIIRIRIAFKHFVIFVCFVVALGQVF